MAEISRETAAKIHDLEARYEENRGRYFVALASALREAGEVGRAEELLRGGLRHYPGSLSAHIVLGRCLADRGALDEATHEFRYVLSVDPQNLIALRTLGEMSASTGRTEEASRWYRELLAVDPMNKEARDALDALASAPPSPSAAAAFGAPAADEPGEAGYGMIDLAVDPAPAAVPTTEFGVVEPVELDFVVTPMPVEPQQAERRDDDFAPEPPAEFGLVELDTSARADDREPATADPALVDQPPTDFGAWGEISLEPVGGAAEPDEETLRTGDYDSFSFGDVPLDAQDTVPPAPAVPPAPTRAFDDDGDDDVEVVTETMAELYARQGFHDRAADVYRELIRRRGEEPGLVARLAEAERRASGEDEPVAEAWETAAGDLGAPADSLPLLETGLPGLGLPIDPALPSFEPEPPVQLDAPVAFGEPLEGVPSSSAAVTGAGGPMELPDGAAYSPAAAPAFAAEPTGDSFADSFAHGFAGTPATGERTDEVPPSATPVIESTAADVDRSPSTEALEDEPAPERVSGIAEPPYGWDSIGGSHADDPLPVAGVTAPPSAAAPEMPSGEFGVDAGDLAPAVAAGDDGAVTDPDTAALATDQPAASAPAPSTVAEYLSSLLAWRPGMPAAPVAVAAPTAADAASPAEVPTLDASSSFDVAGVSAEDVPEVPDGTATEDEIEAALEGDEVAAAALADVATGDEATYDVADLAMDGPTTNDASADEDLPWMSTATGSPAAMEEPAAPAGEEPAPWDVPLDAPAEPAAFDPFQAEESPAPAQGDEGLYPWEFAGSAAPVAPEPPVETQPVEAPRDEAPAPASGGFSFEDYFATPPEPAAAPAAEAPAPAPVPMPLPEPLPEPAPPPAAAPGAPAAGAADDEEDLESFQAWLQSLKR